jgi:hypothetical protein
MSEWDESADVHCHYKNLCVAFQNLHFVKKLEQRYRKLNCLHEGKTFK